MKTICLLAQFPPPIHGLSKAVETLYSSHLKNKYNFSKIDITNNKKILKNTFQLIRCKSDIIYFTPSQTRGGNLRDLIFLYLIQWKKKKCIVHIHGGFYRQMLDKNCPIWQRRMNYHIIKSLAGGIVLGYSLRNIFEDLLPDEKIFICPNCVDNKFIASNIEDKLKYIANNQPLQILYLSNFIESKGYKEVLKLAHIAQEKNNKEKFIFHFAGAFFSKEDENYFKKQSKGLNNIKFHGIVSGQKKIDLLNQCHIFILLSRYPNEGQPISIIEAMGNGMAIITTDHAGIPEIASNKNGYSCSKNNIDLPQIYSYLTYCNKERSNLIEVCKNNYNTVKKEYTETQYINKLDSIFEKVCKE